MIFDCHIHLLPGPCDKPEEFLEKTARAGVSGGLIFSTPPPTFRQLPPETPSAAGRLEQLLEFTAHTPGFRPFLWLDPTEPDAIRRVAEARKNGAEGLKVIHSHFFPESVLDVYRAAAEADLPMLFHSGILWNERPSSAYNRPLAFECLMEIPHLRFALAHIAWPWCEEMTALYGKFRHVAEFPGAGDFACFIDLTPGTPPIARRDALRHLYLSGYRIAHNTLFGSDCTANRYDWEWTRCWTELDRGIFDAVAAEAPSWTVPNSGGDGNRETLSLPGNELFRLAYEDNYRAFL